MRDQIRTKPGPLTRPGPCMQPSRLGQKKAHSDLSARVDSCICLSGRLGVGPRKGGQCGAVWTRADLVQVPGTWEDPPPPVAMRTEGQRGRVPRRQNPQVTTGPAVSAFIWATKSTEVLV